MEQNLKKWCSRCYTGYTSNALPGFAGVFSCVKRAKKYTNQPFKYRTYFISVNLWENQRFSSCFSTSGRKNCLNFPKVMCSVLALMHLNAGVARLNLSWQNLSFFHSLLAMTDIGKESDSKKFTLPLLSDRHWLLLFCNITLNSEQGLCIEKEKSYNL